MATRLKEVAVVSLAALEITALITHTDGVFFSLIVAAIAGIGGFSVGRISCEVKP